MNTMEQLKAEIASLKEENSILKGTTEILTSNLERNMETLKETRTRNKTKVQKSKQNEKDLKKKVKDLENRLQQNNETLPRAEENEARKSLDVSQKQVEALTKELDKLKEIVVELKEKLKPHEALEIETNRLIAVAATRKPHLPIISALDDTLKNHKKAITIIEDVGKVLDDLEKNRIQSAAAAVAVAAAVAAAVASGEQKTGTATVLVAVHPPSKKAFMDAFEVVQNEPIWTILEIKKWIKQFEIYADGLATGTRRSVKACLDEVYKATSAVLDTPFIQPDAIYRNKKARSDALQKYLRMLSSLQATQKRPKEEEAIKGKNIIRAMRTSGSLGFSGKQNANFLLKFLLHTSRNVDSEISYYSTCLAMAAGGRTSMAAELVNIMSKSLNDRYPLLRDLFYDKHGANNGKAALRFNCKNLPNIQQVWTEQRGSSWLANKHSGRALKSGMSWLLSGCVKPITYAAAIAIRKEIASEKVGFNAEDSYVYNHLITYTIHTASDDATTHTANLLCLISYARRKDKLRTTYDDDIWELFK